MTIELIKALCPDGTDRIYYPHPFDKLTDQDNTELGCIKIQQRLAKYGIESKVGYNKEADVWSVAILKVPDHYIEEVRIDCLPCSADSWYCRRSRIQNKECE